MLMGESVELSVGNVVSDVGPTGIDLTTSVQVALNHSVQADALCSFDMAPQQRIAVTGAASSMRTGEGEAFTLWKQDATLVIGDTVEKFPPDDAFALMVEDVSAAILGKRATVFPAASSLRVAEILDSVRAVALPSTGRNDNGPKEN
jgi:hypothetical protein